MEEEGRAGAHQTTTARITHEITERVRRSTKSEYYCALYLTLCDFITENHVAFFKTRALKNEYYAMRAVIQEYVDLLFRHETRTWVENHGILPPSGSPHCGCHDKARVASDANELKAFDAWGPGVFIKDVPVTDLWDNDENVWRYQSKERATVWRLFATPADLSYEEFYAEFEADLRTKHVSWRHNTYDTVRRVCAFNRMFASPQLPDYAQVMLQVQRKTNADCMRLVDAFCGVF